MRKFLSNQYKKIFKKHVDISKIKKVLKEEPKNVIPKEDEKGLVLKKDEKDLVPYEEENKFKTLMLKIMLFIIFHICVIGFTAILSFYIIVVPARFYIPNAIIMSFIYYYIFFGYGDDDDDDGRFGN